MLGAAAAADVQAYVTADLRHHPADEHGRASQVALIDVAHWASEFPWCGQAADVLASGLRSGDVLAQYAEADYELLLPDTTPERARVLVDDLRRRLAAASLGSVFGMMASGNTRFGSLRLAKSGASVAAAARNREKLEEVVGEIAAAGGQAAAFALRRARAVAPHADFAGSTKFPRRPRPPRPLLRLPAY